MFSRLSPAEFVSIRVRCFPDAELHIRKSADAQPAGFDLRNLRKRKFRLRRDEELTSGENKTFPDFQNFCIVINRQLERSVVNTAFAGC